MRGKRVLTWLLALALTAGLAVCPAPKAEAASDYYKSWSQGDPAWSGIVMGTLATVGGVGCATVAIAKLIVQAGALDQNSFNPGTLAKYINQMDGYTSEQNVGWTDQWGKIRGWRIPAGIAPNFDYVPTPAGVKYNGMSKEYKDAEIRRLVDQGYQIMVHVGYWYQDQNGTWLKGTHYVAVDNELTKKNGYATIMDSGSSVSSGSSWAVNVNLFARYDYSLSEEIILYKTTCPNHAVSNGKYVEGEGLKCKSCNALFPVTDNYNLKYEIPATVTADTGYLRTMPYKAAALNRTVSKGAEVTVVGRAENAYGNLWFKLSDGSWMVGNKLALEHGQRIALSADATIPSMLKQGNWFPVQGRVVSLTEQDQKSAKLTGVKVGVKDGAGNWTAQMRSFTPNTTTFNLAEADLYILFDKLAPGFYYYSVEATDTAGETDVLNYSFTVDAVHTHSYVTLTEAEHPHREYRFCSSCGNSYYTGNTGYSETCDICKPSGPYIVSFNANGGVLEDADSKKLNPGDVYGLLPVPTRDGYLFRGWATDPGGTNLVGDLDIFTAEAAQVLYAQWSTGPAGTLTVKDGDEIVKMYAPIRYGVSQEQARLICEGNGGNLMDVRAELDREFLTVICTDHPDQEFWIGLARDGEDWRWDTGAALEEELPWGEGEPGEGCAVYYDTTARTLHAGDGETEARYFVCEIGEDEFPEIPPSLEADVQGSEGGSTTLQVGISALEEDGWLLLGFYDEAGAFLGLEKQAVRAYQAQAVLPITFPEETANARLMLTDGDFCPVSESLSVHVDPACWSFWQESCGVDEDFYEIEARTLYRSRTMETREIEDLFEEGDLTDPGDDWTLLRQDMILDWTEGLTTTVEPQEAWDLEITGTRPLYKYQHWHNTYDGTDLNIDSIAHGTNCIQCSWSTPTKLSEPFYALADMGGKTAYTSDHYCGYSVNRCWWFENGTETEYTYRTAEFVGVWSVYARYGDWSLWQEEPIEEAAGLDVESRTEYRWRLRTD